MLKVWVFLFGGDPELSEWHNGGDRDCPVLFLRMDGEVMSAVEEVRWTNGGSECFQDLGMTHVAGVYNEDEND